MKLLNNFKNSVASQLLQLIALIVVSGLAFSLFRTGISITIGLIAPLITVGILNFIDKNHDKFSIRQQVILSLLISISLMVLVKSWSFYFYGSISSLTVIIFYYLKKFNSVIEYNPINFAVVLGFGLFPVTSFHIFIGAFTFSTPLFALTFILTVYFISRSKNWPVAAAYVFSISVWASLSSLILKESFYFWFAAEWGINGIIFLCLILINTHQFKSLKGMLAFGACVATVKIILKSNEYFYPTYLSLFIISTGLNIYIFLRGPKSA